MNMQRAKIGLLLAGGGSKGILQAGMLKAWMDLGLQYDALYGTSVGALNGCMLHQGSWEQIHELWMTVTNKSIYNTRPWWNPSKYLGKKASVFDSTPLGNLIDQTLDYKKILDNPSRFYVNATDFNTWQPVSFESKQLRREDLVKFVKASASPPVYFEGVEMFGMNLYDGGVSNNYCISQAVRDRMDIIVSMNFARPDPEPIYSVKDALSQTLGISMYGYYGREKDSVIIRNQLVLEANEQPPLREIALIEITPPSFGLPLLDFEYKDKDREELIHIGYSIAYPALRELACQIS